MYCARQDASGAKRRSNSPLLGEIPGVHPESHSITRYEDHFGLGVVVGVIPIFDSDR